LISVGWPKPSILGYLKIKILIIRFTFNVSCNQKLFCCIQGIRADVIRTTSTG
jgi:hypothetical protein